MEENGPNPAEHADETGQLEDARKPPFQQWTRSGYPIVDGKYQDLVKGTIETIEPHERRGAGPPGVALFWYNRKHAGRSGQFSSLAAHGFVNVTEYLVRLGEFFKLKSCKLLSLNITDFAVNIIIATDLSEDDVLARLRQCKLFPT
ncbi:hypothetical protein HIM_10346 [Hirsutella minnesotensis 3608]|uniref:Uncharacterized protein n=1 Tax=Hirsutella minnesotensis 3608 TaxID=1043627 RepID=A0A0F7ZK71_9HYPO|nr:hypothetical protein HIM_10346 [Hirsutella minnesotensis 3608]